MLEITFGKHHWDMPLCMAWKVTVNGVNLTAGAGAGDFYHYSEVDMEFGPWLVSLPDVIAGKEVRIDFTDDPHYFRIRSNGKDVQVAIVWNDVSYTAQHKAVWTQKVSEASTSLVGFIKGIVALAVSLKELTRQKQHSYPDRALREGFKIARNAAKAYGVSPPQNTKE